MSSEPYSIGFVIIGCGYMGKERAVTAIKNIIDTTPSHRIAPKILAIIDPNREALFATLKSIQETFEISDLKKIPTPFSNFPKAVDEVIVPQLVSSQFPIVVYDASPTGMHFANLNYIHELQFDSSLSKNIIYIGEKPIFVDALELEDARKNFDHHFPFFCDFIEVANPVFNSVKQYLEKENVIIDYMQFWRASGAGIKKYFMEARDGVQGGALLDKSLHDLSLAMNFLGPEMITGSTQDAQIHYLVPHPNSKGFGVSAFLSVSNSEIPSSECSELPWCNPADGLLSMSVNWNVPTHPIGIVKSDFLFSWLGVTEHSVENRFESEMKNLGYVPQDYILDYPVEESPVYKMEEVRLGILHCKDRKIVCNFLEKGNIGSLKKYAHVHFDNKPTEKEIIYQDGHSEINDPLSRIFLDVVKYFIGLDKYRYKLVNGCVIFETHGAMLDAQRKALQKISIKRSTDWFKEAKKMVESKRR
jgi:predicted dehydrogenase